jgi:hypothetical protein
MGLANKLLIGAIILLVPSGIIKAQPDLVTRKPSYSQEFWKSKEGFKYIKGDTIYKIKNSREILTIENSLQKTEIIDTNHYGNVEAITLEDKNNGEIKRFEKGEISPNGGAYLYYFPAGLSDKDILEKYGKYDKKFREFKKENNIEEVLEKFTP